MKYSLLLLYFFSVGSAYSSYYITNTNSNSTSPYYYSLASHTTPNIKKGFTKPCKLWSAQQFAYYFSVSNDNPLIQYPLYVYPAFCNYIKNLPSYAKHIKTLHTKFHSDKKSKKDLLKDTGFSEKKFKQIVCKLHKEIQEEEKSLQQKAYCYQQEQESKKKRLQQLKEVQQNTMRQQKDRVEYCVFEWQDRLNNADYNALYLQKRLDAFDKKGSWQEVAYRLSYDANSILRAQKLNTDHFGVLYGNEIQHVLHSEFVEIVNECARLYRNYESNSQVKILSERVFECVELGVQYNRIGNIATSSRLADFCNSLFKYTKAIASGLVQGVILDEVDMLMHPIETAKNILGLMYNIAYYAGALIFEGVHLSYLQFTDPLAASDKVQTYKNNTATLMRALYEKSQELSGPGIVQGGARIISGIATGSWLCSRVYKTLKVLPGKIAERAAEVVRVVQEEELIGVTTNGVKARLIDSMDKAKDVAGELKQRIKNITYSVRERSVVKHNFKYHSRIRERAIQDPLAHNFPYSFDDIILKTRPIVQKDGSLLFRAPGTLNRKSGFFEIALNQENQTIFHRTFIGSK